MDRTSAPAFSRTHPCPHPFPQSEAEERALRAELAALEEQQAALQRMWGPVLERAAELRAMLTRSAPSAGAAAGAAAAAGAHGVGLAGHGAGTPPGSLPVSAAPSATWATSAPFASRAQAPAMSATAAVAVAAPASATASSVPAPWAVVGPGGGGAAEGRLPPPGFASADLVRAALGLGALAPGGATAAGAFGAGSTMCVPSFAPRFAKSPTNPSPAASPPTHPPTQGTHRRRRREPRAEWAAPTVASVRQQFFGG